MESPDYIYKIAWMEVYKVFGEQLRQAELDLLDGVLAATIVDEQIRIFP